MFRKQLIQNLSFLLILLIVQVTIVRVSNADDSIAQPLVEVQQSCQNKLNFKSIREFETFMSNFKLIIEDKDYFNSLIANDKIASSLQKCLDDKEALLALENLVSTYDKQRACKFSEIGKLEDYVSKWLMNKKQRPISIKFFTLFSVNIGFHCKRNLLAHLKQADSEVDDVDFIYSMASPGGWDVLINEMTKKSMKFGGSTHASSSIINRVAQLVPGLVQIEQLDYLIFNHPMNEVLEKNWTGLEVNTYKISNKNEMNEDEERIDTKLIEKLDRIINSCKNLEQLYLNSILSLARLNSLGLVVRIDSLDVHHEHSARVHKWLAAASFCQVLVRVKATTGAEGSADEIILQLQHKDIELEHRRKLYSYVADFEEISKEALDTVWLAGVPESQWFQKNQAVFRQKEVGDISVAMNRLRQFIRGLEQQDNKAQEQQ